MIGAGLFKCAASVANLLGAQVAAPATDLVVGPDIRGLRCVRHGRGGPARGAIAAPPAPRATARATLRPHRCRQGAVGRPRRLRNWLVQRPRGRARARTREDCALGGRIISMHSAGVLASPPPGLLSLRLVPRAPRVLGSPALAGLPIRLLVECVAARAARSLADRAHRDPRLRRLARRDACTRSRGAHARARAWSRRSLPPFLPPPLAKATWRSA